jgi:hypothetical protein
MKQYIFLPVFLLLLYACGNNPKSTNSSEVVKVQQQESPIKGFIRKFKVLPFPFYYLGWARNDYYKDQSFELNWNSTDSLFYTKSDVPVYGYAMLADTSKFYSLIYFETGDEIYPVLVTYSKNGQQLSKEALLVTGCGSDCGLKYCSYTAQIDKGFSIYIADTLKYDGMCDSTGNYAPDSDSTFIYSKTGQVNKTGVIKLGEEQVQRNRNK